MKPQNLFTLLLFTLSAVVSCKKDTFKPTSEIVFSNSSSSFKHFDWTEKEKRFFSLQNKQTSTIEGRGLDTTMYLYHPLLINAYNAIAEENDTEPFAENLFDEVGLPLWGKSFVYSHNNSNLVALPLIKDGQPKINGVIAAHIKTGGEVVIEAKSRAQLLYNDTGKRYQGQDHLKQKLGFLE